MTRSAPVYPREILPLVRRGSSALVVAHGAAVHALVGALEGLTPTVTEALEIATGELLMYDVAADARLIRVSVATTRLL